MHAVFPGYGKGAGFGYAVGMRFFADLHVHSRYSRATSRTAGLAAYAAWARCKGLAVVGTGDCTHPGWQAELKDSLVPSAAGLFRLRPELAAQVERQLAAGGRPAAVAGAPATTQFLLQTEISTIYRQGGRTRKVHHVICVPGFVAAERLTARLARIGNLAADGRPTLGLTSRDLLAMTLEADADCFLFPAHIWTPWFSVLGAKSGFDSIEECYGDFAPHVFALETGLSSDPPMNWRVGRLDRFRLISNSDAHSPAKLGREATVFDVVPDYFAIRRALETGAGYGGTLEFFPEEGKYFHDGHRACGVSMQPGETQQRAGGCPVCGHPVTMGVLHRVEELAVRSGDVRPPSAGPYRSLVPLAELLAEAVQTAATSQRVQRAWRTCVEQLGPELFILEGAAQADLERVGPPRLAEAILRMRRGAVRCEAGYDGVYGRIHCLPS